MTETAIPDFESGAFNRSATSPGGGISLGLLGATRQGFGEGLDNLFWLSHASAADMATGLPPISGTDEREAIFDELAGVSLR